MRTFDNGTANNASPTPGSYLSDFAILTNNTSTGNTLLGGKLINDAIRYLATVFYFNEKSYTVPGGTVAQQQGYTLPGDFEVMEDVTVSVGGYLWQPTASPSRKHFDLINLIPYYNDYPQFYYIWNNQLNLWPIPSTSNNVITFNYKSRIVELSMADSSAGTVAITTNTNAITGSGSSFASWMAQSGWMKIAHSTDTTAANGDNRWYPISSVASTTGLTLKNNYVGSTVSAGTYVIGDVPILPEDYQDLPLYRALYIYFTSIVPNPQSSQLYMKLYDSGYERLNEKYGNKTYSPVLTDVNTPVYNPNLFPRNLG